jgi:class 3 adenylate cyclase
MRRPKSFVFQTTVLIFIALAVYQVIDSRLNLKTEQVEYQNSEKWILRHHLLVGREMLRLGAVDRLHLILEDSRKSKRISAYLLQQGDQVLWFGNEAGLAGINDHYKADGQMYEMKNTVYGTVSAESGNGELILTVFSAMAPETVFSIFYTKHLEVIAQWLLLALVCIAGVIAYYFKSFSKIINRMKNHGQRDFTGIVPKSNEDELLLRGFTGFQQHVNDLSARNRLLDAQVMPSMKSEIDSGRQPPYDFMAAMAQIDLNGFTDITESGRYDVKQFEQINDAFFSRAKCTIARYNGLTHEFGGDAVLFYFKDEDCENARLMAMCAIRDILKIADEYDEFTRREHGYPYRYKCCISYGKTSCKPTLFAGLSIKGQTYVWNSRLQKAVHKDEKSDHTIFIEERDVDSVSSLFQMSFVRNTRPDGYSRDIVIYKRESEKSLSEVLESLRSGDAKDLRYYRSDSHLIETLNFLKANWNSLQEGTVFKAIGVLKGFPPSNYSEAVVSALTVWLESMRVGVANEANSEIAFRILASASKLAINLVPPDLFDGHAKKTFEGLLQLLHGRVKSDAIDVLSHFKSADSGYKIPRILHIDNNRLDGNVLVFEGKSAITRSVIKRIRKKLDSNDDAIRATCIFAVGEIASFHIKRDVIYYGQQIAFLEIVNMLPRFVLEENESVRRQAFIAAGKISDLELINKVHASVEKSGRAELLEEFSKYVGLTATSFVKAA